MAMEIINLKDYYWWYTQDEFIEVSDEVAAELNANKRYEKAHKRRTRRNKICSLDEIQSQAQSIIYNNESPEIVLELIERHCNLCYALNSLPEIQGKRIEAHYLLGKSIKQIAEQDGVTERSVRKSINRGLQSMKNFLKNI